MGGRSTGEICLPGRGGVGSTHDARGGREGQRCGREASIGGMRAVKALGERTRVMVTGRKEAADWLECPNRARKRLHT